jgi:hypothetical protein
MYDGTHLPFIQQESTFWRRRLVEKVDLGLLRTYKLAGDFFLWHTFAKHTNLFIVKTLLGGFRVSKNQLSKQREEYDKEFHLIAEHQRMPDKVFAHALRFLGRVLSDDSKLTLNREIIRFHHNRWWKPDTARLDKIVGLIPSQEMRSLLARIFR